MTLLVEQRGCYLGVLIFIPVPGKIKHCFCFNFIYRVYFQSPYTDNTVSRRELGVCTKGLKRIQTRIEVNVLKYLWYTFDGNVNMTGVCKVNYSVYLSKQKSKA